MKQFFQYHKDNNWDLPYTDKQAKIYILHRYKQGKKWQAINGDYSAIRKFFIKVRDLEWDIYNLPCPRKESKLPKIICRTKLKSGRASLAAALSDPAYQMVWIPIF